MTAPMTLNALMDALYVEGIELVLLNQSFPIAKGQIKLYAVRGETKRVSEIMVSDHMEEGCKVFVPYHSATPADYVDLICNR